MLQQRMRKITKIDRKSLGNWREYGHSRYTFYA